MECIRTTVFRILFNMPGYENSKTRKIHNPISTIVVDQIIRSLDNWDIKFLLI
jgi:hypothetical protein